MSSEPEHAVELLEGNATLRELLTGALRDAGFEVRTESGDELADLLVADVDAGDDASERLEAYRSASRPVLVCGVESSRSEWDIEPWLDRPFEPTEFLDDCRHALGLEVPETVGELEEVSAGAEESGLEIDADDSDGEGDEEGEVLEIDDASSMVVDVQDVEELDEGYGAGGAFAGGVEREQLDLESLRAEAEDLEATDTLGDPESNPSLPDVPDHDGSEESRRQESGIRQVDSDAGPASNAGTTGSRRNPAQGSGPVEPDSVAGAKVPAGDRTPGGPRGGEPSGGGRESEREWPGSAARDASAAFERELAEIASLLADSWGRLGLTARSEDRTERLNRIFSAAVEGGVARAADELDRIPPAHGFTGVLEVFSPFELVRLIRRREFLGRLEVSNASSGYVLYFDGNRLVGIDDLEGRSEAMLLDCLRQSASVDEELYRELKSTVENSLAAPLEMRLRTEQLVTEEQLLDARRTRAKWVVKEVLNASTGNFAFIHGGDESGQPWPVNELGLSVDVLLLELLRDGSIDWRASDREDAPAFVTAGHRLGDEQQTALALVERGILKACRTPASLDRIVREVDGERSEVEEAVHRLFAIGFLHPTTAPDESGARSGPHRAADKGETAARKHPGSGGYDRESPAGGNREVTSTGHEPVDPDAERSDGGGRESSEGEESS